MVTGYLAVSKNCAAITVSFLNHIFTSFTHTNVDCLQNVLHLVPILLSVCLLARACTAAWRYCGRIPELILIVIAESVFSHSSKFNVLMWILLILWSFSYWILWYWEGEQPLADLPCSCASLLECSCNINVCHPADYFNNCQFLQLDG